MYEIIPIIKTIRSVVTGVWDKPEIFNKYSYTGIELEKIEKMQDIYFKYYLKQSHLASIYKWLYL